MDYSDRKVWRVLLVDDDEDDFLLTREMLSQAQGRKIVLDWAPTYQDGQLQLHSSLYDAVLVDYDLGLHTGIDLIRETTSQGYRAPLILYTGRGSYAVDVEAMQAGATLYLTKAEANPLLLERSIRYAVERKRFEQERLDLIESIQDDFFAVDREWKITYINRRAALRDGYEPEQLVGRNIWEAFPRLLGTPAEQNYCLVMETRESMKFEMQEGPQGVWYGISVFPFHEGISIQLQDINERKQVEQALRESERQQRELARSLELDRSRSAAVLENLPVGVWIADGQGQLIGKNEQADRIWAGDAPLVESIEKYQQYFAWFADSGEVVPPEEYPVARVLHTGQPVEPVELNIRRFDGTQGTVLVSAAPFKDSQGQLAGVVGVNVDITERKQVEESLRFSEQRFSKAFNATPGALVISRLADGLIEMVNDSFEQLFGYTRGEVIGKTSLQLNMFAHPEDRDEFIKRLHTEHSIRDLETDIRIKSGEIRQANLSVEMLTVGSEFYILTIIEDVTARNRAEEALRESAAMLRMALDAGRAGAWSWDLSTNSILWSDEYYRIFGFEPGGLQPTAEDGFSRVHPDDLPGIQALVQDAIERGTQIDAVHRVIWPDGSVHWVRGISRAFYNEQKKPYRMAGIAIDMTEQKLAEIELQAAHRRTVEILESISDSFYSLDREGRFTYVNQRAAGLWGKQPGELLGKNIWEVFPSGKATESYRKIQQAFEERQPIQYESYSAFLNQWVDIHIYPTEHGISVYFQDITERKREEETLAAYAHELERSNRDLQEFAFVASHDLQEPLRKIEALGDMILDGSTHLPERQQDQLIRLRKSAGRLRTMVDGLLQLSRLSTQAQPFQPVDLRLVTQEVLSDLELLIKRTGAVVEVGDLPVISADPLQMRQLLQNLIGNALKFQPPGGKPRLKVFSRRPKPESVQILVQDNGIGFDEELAERLFQPFQRLVGRSEYEGSGMGLAIARKIVERHGGEIVARSQSGHGATLIVTLPSLQNDPGR